MNSQLKSGLVIQSQTLALHVSTECYKLYKPKYFVNEFEIINLGLNRTKPSMKVNDI